MTQSQIIKNLIEKAGSIKELSLITETSVPRIYEWKNEFYAMSFIKLLEMCKMMRIDLKDLL